MIKYICKRDGAIVPFEMNKIVNAIMKAIKATHSHLNENDATMLAKQVVDKLNERQSEVPTVELVQDVVEETLVENGYVRMAKAYILYRDSHNRERKLNASKYHILDEIEYISYVDDIIYVDMIQFYEKGFIQENYDQPDLLSFSDYIFHLTKSLTPLINEEGVLLHCDYALTLAMQKSYSSLYLKNMLRVLQLCDIDEEVLEGLLNVDLLAIDDYLMNYLSIEQIDSINEFVNHYAMEDLEKELKHVISMLCHHLNVKWSIDYDNDQTSLGLMVKYYLDMYLKNDGV